MRREVVKMSRGLSIILCGLLLISLSIATKHHQKVTKPGRIKHSHKMTTTRSPPLVCGDNEVVDNCPVDCPADNCPKSIYDSQSKCPKPGNCPAPACKCGFNSRRADNGTCISTRDCPPFECDSPNEEFDPCPVPCPGEDCSQATPDGKCHLPGYIRYTVECKPACKCKKHFWKLNGLCIPYELCPKKNGTMVTAPETPTTKSWKDDINNTSDTTENNMENQLIITNLTCGNDEVIDDCPVDCPSDNCPKSRYDDQSTCVKLENCPQPVCKCGYNARRALNGSCISTRDCPPFKCSGPNEEYNPCPIPCPGENCSQATADDKCHMVGVSLFEVECVPACRCQKTFWRLNGVCVPYKKCLKENRKVATSNNGETSNQTTDSSELTCGDNELVDNCPTDCPYDNCPKSRYDDQSYCPKPENCSAPACKCDFNTRRAANGSCISTRDCPPFECSGPNEEYNPCPVPCPGENCSQATPDGECDAPGHILITVECKPACRCKKTYWRQNGVCVPYNECKKENSTVSTTTEKSIAKPTTKPKKSCKHKQNYFRKWKTYVKYNNM